MHALARSAIAVVFLLAATASHAVADFSGCPQFFANARPPILTTHPNDRALCYDAFAILHSGESKTPVFVAEKLNRE